MYNYPMTNHHIQIVLFSIAFPILVAGTVMMLVVYAAIQQSYRQSADDPQIELAEDAAAALSDGNPASDFLSGMPKTDMSKSLASFMMIFDDSGELLASSAYFNGTSPTSGLPTPPHGVFDFVRSNDGTAAAGNLGTINGFRIILRLQSSSGR